jgi:hypothetical protein
MYTDFFIERNPIFRERSNALLSIRLLLVNLRLFF